MLSQISEREKMKMRKKINPILVISLLFSMTIATFSITLYLQASALRGMHGNAIRICIVNINDLTDSSLEALEDGNMVKILYFAGEIKGNILAGEINPDYKMLLEEASNELFNYGHILSTNKSSTVLQVQKSICVSKVTLLRDTSRFIISNLAAANSDKMNKSYFDTISQTTRFNALISGFILDRA